MHQDHPTRRLRRARALARTARPDMRPALRLALSISMFGAVLYALNALI